VDNKTLRLQRVTVNEGDVLEHELPPTNNYSCFSSGQHIRLSICFAVCNEEKKNREPFGGKLNKKGERLC